MDLEPPLATVGNGDDHFPSLIVLSTVIDYTAAPLIRLP
jgi:hypothetical protein